MRKSEFDKNFVYTNIFESTVEGFELKELILKCLGVEVCKYLHTFYIPIIINYFI